jgi:hypothetical protein
MLWPSDLVIRDKHAVGARLTLAGSSQSRDSQDIGSVSSSLPSPVTVFRGKPKDSLIKVFQAPAGSGVTKSARSVGTFLHNDLALAATTRRDDASRDSSPDSGSWCRTDKPGR